MVGAKAGNSKSRLSDVQQNKIGNTITLVFLLALYTKISEYLLPWVGHKTLQEKPALK